MVHRYISAKYDASLLTVDYVANDGTHLLRTGGTIAWRFNNPGNLRPGGGTRLIRGAIAIGRTSGNASFLIFGSYADGRAAKKGLLREKYNDRTIYTMLTGIPNPKGGMMLGYAPASDNNDPLDYAKSIASHIGKTIDTVLSTLSDAEMEKMLDAMEKKEGYHGKQATRRERLIATTGITVSDGAQARPDTPVQVKIGSKVHLKKTDKFGQIPRIAHTKPGEKVEIFLPTGGVWKKQFEFQMSAVSSAYVLFNDIMRFEAPVAPKKAPKPATPAVRKPIRYPVAPGDTLGKLATRFKTSVARIRKDNPSIKNADKIYQGQVIGIYGPVTPLQAPKPIAVPVAAPAAAPPPSPSAPVQAAAPAISNAGQPIAVVQAALPKAPWMTYAIEEAKRFHGRNEGIITNIRNYHADINFNATMVQQPWCASFVNTCLKSTNTPFVNSPSSQFPCNSSLFVRIDKPVFGAIMVMRNYKRIGNQFQGKGHVTLVYGKTAAGRIAGLGGNQNDRITVSGYKLTGESSAWVRNGIEYYQKFHAFYIPASYLQYAQLDADVPLEVVSLQQVNTQVFNISSADLSNSQSSL